MKVTFKVLSLKKIVRGICPECNKKATRTLIVEQTLNPFNKNINGFIKNESEIYKELREKINSKIKMPVMHRKCKEKLKEVKL